jgi:Tfp pilus assembly protein PilO
VNRRAVIVGVAGAVVLGLLWFFLLWSPQSGRLDAAEERETAAAQTNSGLEVTLQRLRDLEARRPELEDQLARLRRAVPDQPQLARFLLSADDAAERSGVVLTTVTPARPAADASTTAATTAPTTATTATDGDSTSTTATTAPPAPTTSAISLSFEVAGGYFQVLDFLNRMDDLPRIVVVDSLDLRGGEVEGEGVDVEGGTPTGDLTASITARMFTGAAPSADGSTTGAGATTATTTATTTAPTGSSNTGTDQ